MVNQQNNDIRNVMLQKTDGNKLETPYYQRGCETDRIRTVITKLNSRIFQYIPGWIEQISRTFLTWFSHKRSD